MATKKQKESDKDLLFNKLLPALNENPFSATYDSDSANTPTFKDTEEDMSALDPDISDTPDSLSALHSRLFARTSSYDTSCFATINIMESLVLKYIDRAIQRFNACGCDRCKCDVAAYSLNNLPPKYIVASPSKVEEAEKEIPQKMVMDALVNAVIHVRTHPRH